MNTTWYVTCGMLLYTFYFYALYLSTSSQLKFQFFLCFFKFLSYIFRMVVVIFWFNTFYMQLTFLYEKYMLNATHLYLKAPFICWIQHIEHWQKMCVDLCMSIFYVETNWKIFFKHFNVVFEMHFSLYELHLSVEVFPFTWSSMYFVFVHLFVSIRKATFMH